MDEIFTLDSFICQCNELLFFLEQKELFIVLTNKFPFLHFESTLKRLLVAFYLSRNTEKLDLFQTQNNILRRSFYTIHLY
jgi:hypothetical protein